jgi:uncharacterized protein
MRNGVGAFMRQAIAAALLIIAVTLPAAARDFPALTGRVVDQANILDAQTQSALTDKLAALEAKTTSQLVVVTLKSLQGTSIEDFGVQLGRHWGIGQKGKNNGALLIVAPTERKVRVEVGYGLEGALTDALTKFIIENSILPRFKASDMPGGIRRGVDDLIQIMQGEGDEFKKQAVAQQTEMSANDWVMFAVVIGIFGFICYGIFAAIRGLWRAIRSSRKTGKSTWSTLTTGTSSSSSWGSSWSSGSSGGFSGGGGSFGGGGSSGSW